MTVGAAGWFADRSGVLSGVGSEVDAIRRVLECGHQTQVDDIPGYVASDFHCRPGCCRWLLRYKVAVDRGWCCLNNGDIAKLWN